MNIASEILAIALITSLEEDGLVWIGNKAETYMVKSTYNHSEHKLLELDLGSENEQVATNSITFNLATTG